MEHWQYTKGLHDLGNGIFAYLQPDGSWGWSNAGFITDSGQSLLVDTLFDLALTGEMIEAIRKDVGLINRTGAWSIIVTWEQIFLKMFGVEVIFENKNQYVNLSGGVVAGLAQQNLIMGMGGHRSELTYLKGQA
jgi:hypothetical protein